MSAKHRLYRDAKSDYWEARSRRARRILAFRRFVRTVLIVVIVVVILVVAAYIVHREFPHLAIHSHTSAR